MVVSTVGKVIRKGLHRSTYIVQRRHLILLRTREESLVVDTKDSGVEAELGKRRGKRRNN